MVDSLARSFQLQDCCQSCGRPFEKTKDKFGIALTFTTLSYKGNQIRLTLRESKIMEGLLKAMPNEVAKEHLFLSVWNVNTEAKIMEVYICKIRKKLKNLGVRIETIWGVGYKLVVE